LRRFKAVFAITAVNVLLLGEETRGRTLEQIAGPVALRGGRATPAPFGPRGRTRAGA
jgi:hypothetical protein